MTTAQQICVPYLYCLALYQKTPVWQCYIHRNSTSAWRF